MMNDRHRVTVLFLSLCYYRDGPCGWYDQSAKLLQTDCHSTSRARFGRETPDSDLDKEDLLTEYLTSKS
jgi:hypothetical protein